MIIKNIIIFLALFFVLLLSILTFREVNLLKQNFESELEIIKSQLMDLDNDIHSLEDDD
jgi:hypothetical protein